MTLPAIAHAVSPYRQLLVGFSGGLDSTVLLHRLKLWRDQEPDVQLRALHVHHGLSPHAEDWVAHCEALCATWGIPLSVERVRLQDEGLGTEAQARKARYAAFARVVQPGEVLVTAQHLDDQCETFLLALKRGSGPAGLSAMPERTDFAGTQLIRPLLRETRASLETWARTHQLSWIEDESNQDDSYDRNFLRLRVVPLLTERWPHFADATARSAMLCAEQESLLDELLTALPDAQAAEMFHQGLSGADGQRQLGELLQFAAQGPGQHAGFGALGAQGQQDALGPVHLSFQQGIDELEGSEVGVADDGLLQIGDADGLGRREQGQLLDLLARGQQVALVGVAHEVDRIR